MKATIKFTIVEVKCPVCECMGSVGPLIDYFDKMAARVNKLIAALFSTHVVDRIITITDKRLDKATLSMAVDFEFDILSKCQFEEKNWIESVTWKVTKQHNDEVNFHLTDLDNKGLVKIKISDLHFIDSKGTRHNAKKLTSDTVFELVL